jgi:hypothetical protein
MPAHSAVKAAAALVGSMAALTLASCSVSVGTLQHHTSSYSVAGPLRILVVHAQAGDVRVQGTDSATVSVTYHKTFERTAPAATHTVHAGTLVLDSNCPALESCGVSYDITVPRAMTVQVYDDVGAIRLDSLSGQVTAHTDVGNIDLRSVSGRIDLSSHAGSIRPGRVVPARNPAAVGGRRRRHLLGCASQRHCDRHRRVGHAACPKYRVVRRGRQRVAGQRPRHGRPQRRLIARHHCQHQNRLYYRPAGPLTSSASG